MPSLAAFVFRDAASLLGHSTGLFLTLRDFVQHGAFAGRRASTWRCPWGLHATAILRGARRWEFLDRSCDVVCEVGRRPDVVVCVRELNAFPSQRLFW